MLVVGGGARGAWKAAAAVEGEAELEAEREKEREGPR